MVTHQERIENNECGHTTVEYGPCMTDETFSESGCRYRTFLKDYVVMNQHKDDIIDRINENIKTQFIPTYEMFNRVANCCTS